MPFKGNNSNKEFPKTWIPTNFEGNIIRIIPATKSFLLSVIVFKILAENCEKKSFFIFEGQQLLQGVVFDPWKLLWALQTLAQPDGFGKI